MIISREAGRTGIRELDRVIPQMVALSGAPGGRFGFDWPLALQIGGWIISGVGHGLSVRDAITGAKSTARTQYGVEILQESEIQAIAASVARADPQHRTASQWEQLVRAQFGPPTPPPAPVQCPPGTYPAGGGVCLPIPEKAGFFDALPTWAWVVMGGMGFLLFRGKLGI